jgi:hypothetical protein
MTCFLNKAKRTVSIALHNHGEGESVFFNDKNMPGILSITVSRATANNIENTH